MSDSDADDWERVRAGDMTGLAGLVDRHEQRLFRHASRLLSVREDAKDATMIAFFELWRKRGRVHVVAGSPLPWLLTTVSNVARNLERSSRRYQAMLSRLDVEDRLPEITAPDETGVLAALRRLSEREQNVIVLAVIEGYSERETAAALGVPVGTVKSRLARAKARLRVDIEGMV
jgi:RNA polymerase sigma-70 factor (ECF subfamily)